MKFLRNLLASIVGFFISITLLFLFFMLIASWMGNADKIIVKQNSVLELDLTLPVKDYAPKDDNPFAEALDLVDEKLGINTILNAIENAKSDNNIKGVSIKTTYVNAGIAQTQAIRNKLREFKEESGKFVYAYADVYDQKNYYLSSVADSVFVNPVGAIDFRGLSAEVLYFKDFEDKYGVKMEVIRHGKYKSAVEPFLTNKMSEANREQTTSFLNSLWSSITKDISESRKVSTKKLNTIADKSLGRNATLSQENKLIDGIIYVDEYEAKIKDNIGKKYNEISIADYIKSGKGRIRSTSKNKIAVIFAQGEIMYGEGNEDVIGQGKINKAIQKAVNDNNVKAIVLRVNSPGGSALASELIWRELELAKKEKPVVVSMGNLAASGGYYIACNANEIFAEPTTITGSIGVFGAIPNVHEFANNIGINAEQVATNNSASYSVFEPITKEFYTVTKEGVEEIYTTFVNRVAKGRNMTFDKVNEIAQGRVWSGNEALNLGLVDKIGGLDDALERAAELAEIDSYRVRNYPSYSSELKDAFKVSPFGQSKEEILKETLGDEHYRLFSKIKEMTKIKGMQARLPYVIDIK